MVTGYYKWRSISNWYGLLMYWNLLYYLRWIYNNHWSFRTAASHFYFINAIKNFMLSLASQRGRYCFWILQVHYFDVNFLFVGRKSSCGILLLIWTLIVERLDWMIDCWWRYLSWSFPERWSITRKLSSERLRHQPRPILLFPGRQTWRLLPLAAQSPSFRGHRK